MFSRNTGTKINIWQATSGKLQVDTVAESPGQQTVEGNRILCRPGMMLGTWYILNKWQLLHTRETNLQTSLRYKIQKRIKLGKPYSKKPYLMNLQKGKGSNSPIHNKVIHLHKNLLKQCNLSGLSGAQRVPAAFWSNHTSKEIPSCPSFCWSLPTMSF